MTRLSPFAALAACFGTVLLLISACTIPSPDSGRVADLSPDMTVADSSRPRFVSVTSGRQFSCSLDEQGTPWCWGANHFGQLGVGDTLDRLAPTRVDSNVRFTHLIAGESHMCATDSLSTLYCWGDNEGYALGDSLVRLRERPAPSNLPRFVQVSAGSHFTCALDAERRASCWGANPHGERGDGERSPAPIPRPVPVQTAERFDSLVTGRTHSCALTSNGAAWCWGHGGALGDGTVQRRYAPVEVRGGLRFTSLTAGESVSCGVDTAAAAWCWGVDFDGQLGEGAVKVPNRFEPMLVSGPVRFRKLSAGLHRVCGLDLEGYAWCWGSNYNGGLGVGGSIPSAAPMRVLGERTYVHLAAGDYHTCAVDTVGAVWCWGQNSDPRGGGALGDGTLNSRDEPAPVAAPMVPAGAPRL